MSKKNILIVIIAILFIGAGAYYFYQVKAPAQVNQQGEEQNNEGEQPSQEEVVLTPAEKELRDKVLELVGMANEGKTDEALTGYLALLKDNPTDLMLLNNIADLYSDKSDWANSEKYYKLLITAHPDFIQGYRMLAYLYQYRFNDDEVKIKALMDSGLKATNNNADLLNWMIAYYQGKDEGEKALPYSQMLADQLNKK